MHAVGCGSAFHCTIATGKKETVRKRCLSLPGLAALPGLILWSNLISTFREMSRFDIFTARP